jgi:hypothetical protein
MQKPAERRVLVHVRMPSTHRLVSNNKAVNEGCAAHGRQDSGIAFKVKPGTAPKWAESPGNAETSRLGVCRCRDISAVEDRAGSVLNTSTV